MSKTKVVRPKMKTKKSVKISPLDGLGTVVAVDTGNGETTAAVYRDGSLVLAQIPHARARVTGDTISAEGGFGVHKINYADWQGLRYGVGDGIWNLASAPIETDQGDEGRYTNDMHRFLTFYNIAQTGIPTDTELVLAMACPPGLYNSVAKEMKKSYLLGEDGNKDGKWTISLDNKKPVTYFVKKVIVYPEGAPAWAAHRWDIAGEFRDMRNENGYDRIAGKTAVVDLGFGTGDSFLIINGNLSPESLTHATNAGASIKVQIIEPIRTAVKQSTKLHLSPPQIDSILREWIKARRPASLKRQIGGLEIDFGKMFNIYVQQYADFVRTQMLQPAFAQGADSVLCTGGGWLYIQHIILDYYKDRTPHRDFVLPEDGDGDIQIWNQNVVGMLHALAATAG